jgi:ABC-2 type transport system permease protein
MSTYVLSAAVGFHIPWVWLFVCLIVLMGILGAFLAFRNVGVLLSVFRRNFVSYFANPTGYVFICLFVLPGAFCAFWVPDFFGNNLANLDQLSFWFPFIMLFYIPTITMGIWADERKQGTDELLLTIPAGDFDVVLGKFLAALAIFTVSLLFSLVCNYLTLNYLASTGPVYDITPRLDLGLFLGTYAGYWLVGLAMLGIGMVGSFLTSNVTIGFVLGVLFNLPLVFLSAADAVFGMFGREGVLAAKRWSIGDQMHDFSRGILSLTGAAYFCLIVVVTLYVAMVLIGRRHWKVDKLPSLQRFVFAVIALVIVAPVLHVLVRGLPHDAVSGFFFGLRSVWFAAVLPLCFLPICLAVSWEPIRRVSAWAIAIVIAAVCIDVLVALIAGWSRGAFLAWELVWLGAATPLLLIAILKPQVVHFAYRTLALVAIAVGIVVILHHHDLRLDATSEQLSSLSPATRKLIADLDTKRPVLIEAFVSPSVPEAYVQTRLNLLATLRELQALGGDKLQVKIRETDRYSDEAALAQKRYGIEPRQVMTSEHGAYSVDPIFLNVSVSRGTARPIPPVFIDRDTPIEYELVRSICTVTQQKRKKLGVLNTDAQLYGSFNMQTMSPSPNWPIIDELEKQYDVVRVDPAKPIVEKYDVLLAVQPSTLGPQEMKNFVGVVAGGQPTVIFEDPMPIFPGVPASSQPRQPPGGMNPMMRMPSPPKGDISELWTLLGIDFQDAKIVWQDFNPYPKLSEFSKNKEFVFVDVGCGAKQPFSATDPISSGLQQVLFLFPGYIEKRYTSQLKFTPLAETGEKTGTERYKDILQMTPFGPRGIDPDRVLKGTGTDRSYCLAAHIEGTEKWQPPMEEPFKAAERRSGKAPAAKKPGEATINAVVITDTDMLSQVFFAMRDQGDQPGIGVHFRFDNVTFVLNALDALAGDNRFIEIRKRRLKHRILARVEEETKDAKKEAAEARERIDNKRQDNERAEQKLIDDKIAELKNQKNLDLQQMAIQVGMMQQDLERQRESKMEQLRRENDREFSKIETKVTSRVRRVQLLYKMLVVGLAPILPLFLALVVFVIRRLKEREGVAKSRLR